MPSEHQPAGRTVPASCEAERFLSQSNLETAFTVIRGMQSLDRVQAWVGYENRNEGRRMVLEALAAQASKIRVQGAGRDE